MQEITTRQSKKWDTRDIIEKDRWYVMRVGSEDAKKTFCGGIDLKKRKKKRQRRDDDDGRSISDGMC